MMPLISTMALAALAALLASVLFIAHRHLRIDEDPRLEALEAALPGINCGACGQPSCQAFAQALLRGDAVPAGCTVSTPAARQRIADFLDIAVGEAHRQVARLACAGGRNIAPARAQYRGEPTCAAAAVAGGGGKACRWGCLHYGDCQHACTFDAIHLDAHGLPEVDEALCTACGDCVSACPKDLFKLEPAEHKVWVTCVNPEAGNALLEVCAAACTACGRCAQDAPAQIQMAGNLPVVDASRGSPPRAAIERCPTGAIVWIDNGRSYLGAEAARPARRHDLPVQPA